jgi:ketosteroid isomerase-like protein
MLHKATFLASLLVVFAPLAVQTQKPPANSGELFATINALDKDFFEAYNKCDVNKIDSLFTDDIEFYHEKRGQLVGRKNVMDALAKNLCGDKSNRVRRELVDGTMRVYVLEGFGALALGEHRFYLTMGEQKEKLDGIGHFANVWQLKDGQWRMSRVLSYGFRSE